MKKADSTNTHTLMLSGDWWKPTSAVDLIGCYFTTGGGALRVYISEDEASQRDVCLVHINLKLHCGLSGRGGAGRRGGGEKEVWRIEEMNPQVLNP